MTSRVKKNTNMCKKCSKLFSCLKNLKQHEKRFLGKCKLKKIGNSGTKVKVPVSLPHTNLDVVVETKKKVRILYSSKFEGNSDADDCSIDSAALDEDICFDCGKNTLNEPDWGSLIFCDNCNGEYHLKCMGLELPPRKNWICKSCKEEELAFEGLKYKMDGFPLKRKSRPNPKICYSPSKPLSEAWEECKYKGFMSVSKVFSYDILK